jgi:hypothetical protein
MLVAQKTEEDRDRGGLPCTVWAKERERLAARYLEIKFIESDQRTVPVNHVGEPQCAVSRCRLWPGGALHKVGDTGGHCFTGSVCRIPSEWADGKVYGTSVGIRPRLSLITR